MKYEGVAVSVDNVEYIEKKLLFFTILEGEGAPDTFLQRMKDIFIQPYNKIGGKYCMKREISMSFMAEEPVYLLFQESTSYIYLSKNIDTLNIYQFPHNNKRIYLEKCKSNELLKLHSYCLNITMNNSPNKYLFIRGNIKCNVELNNTCNFLAMPLSWNDASDMCEHFGGYLPILRNKDEMEEFISLIKSTKGLPLIENVFIGLHYYKVG